MANLVSATLRLWIYTGDFTSQPEEPNYIIYKEKLPSSEKIIFEIGELVKDYIDVEFKGTYYDIKQSAWAKWEITRLFDDESTNTDISGSAIGFLGYGYFQDGINPQLSNDLLQSNLNIFHNCDEPLYIPILLGEDGVFKVEYYDGSNLISSNTFGNEITPLKADTIDYYAANKAITADRTFLKNTSSNPITTLMSPQEPFNRIEIITASGVTITLNVYCLDCSKYNMYKVSFINKFGVIQDMWFDKKRTDNLDVNKSSYKRNTLDLSGELLTYSVNSAQMMPHDVIGNNRITMNTGFVTEDYNELIQELMLTESAWIHEDNDVTPIVPKTSSFTYKTGVDDKLINFTVEFDYAFDTINNIR